MSYTLSYLGRPKTYFVFEVYLMLNVHGYINCQTLNTCIISCSLLSAIYGICQSMHFTYFRVICCIMCDVVGNHSCSPNAEVTFPDNNFVLTVKASSHIKSGEVNKFDFVIEIHCFLM